MRKTWFIEYLITKSLIFQMLNKRKFDDSAIDNLIILLIIPNNLSVKGKETKRESLTASHPRMGEKEEVIFFSLSWIIKINFTSISIHSFYYLNFK